MTILGPDQAVLYCVGAQKSATTWLFDQLSRLPECHGDAPKEMAYWASIRSPFINLGVVQRTRLGIGYPGIAGQLRERLSPELRAKVARVRQLEAIYRCDPFDHAKFLDYLGYGARPEKWLLDFSTVYARLGPTTFVEMLEATPGSKFLFLMRDPVERLWSGIKQRYRHVLSSGAADVTSMRRLYGMTIGDPGNVDLFFSRYDLILETLFDGVPRDRVLTLFYEDLFDPTSAKVTEAALRDFLDIETVSLSREEVVYSSILSGADGPDPADEARAVETLGPVYDYVRKLHEGRLPEAWLKRAP